MQEIEKNHIESNTADKPLENEPLSPEVDQLSEDEMIEQAFQELMNDYLATKHRKRVEIITRAFNFANQAHKGIRRLSGEPYIMHPLSVAKIVCNEIGLGSTSICAALLHDVVEDTDYTTEDIANIFGPKIAQIVDGLTKISGGIFGEHASAQAENFKKLLLTMNDDIRVILIKIADRLHNMRTLESQAPNKQYKIAGETLYLYAPLAYRLGLNKIKTELENLSFKYEHPEEYHEIEEKLKETAAERDKVFTEFTAPIRQQLDKMGLKYRIIARVKAVYSIWSKMQTKHVPFDEVYDILAVRIIFEPVSMEEELNNCFDIYVGLSQIYKPHPDRIRDWVSHPKANGYQALHVTLMANNGQWIEVQIRSERMNDIAEQGFAAHWKYKDGGQSEDISHTEDDTELNKWLVTIKEILDDPQPDALDFLDTIKLNLFAQEIFVFTPKGEIKTMPQNSTALDFAFYLHTEIGAHCIGAKVNHKLVPLSHKLNSGDQVEILTSRSQHVQQEWENIAATAKARAKIASILRKEAKVIQQRGLEMLNEFLKEEHIYVDEMVLNKLTRSHEMPNPDSLLEAIGNGKIQLGEEDLKVLTGKTTSSWRRFLKLPFGHKEKSENATTDEQNTSKQPLEKKEVKKITKQILKLTEDAIQKNYEIADCCHPIPGDDVLGYIDTKGKITIHKRQCPIAAKLKSSYGNRIIATQWDTHKQLTFLVTINIKGLDRLGLLSDVTQVISHQLNVNIRKLTIETQEGIFEGHIELYVHDVDDVNAIIGELKRIRNIQEVIRE